LGHACRAHPLPPGPRVSACPAPTPPQTRADRPLPARPPRGCPPVAGGGASATPPEAAHHHTAARRAARRSTPDVPLIPCNAVLPQELPHFILEVNRPVMLFLPRDVRPEGSFVRYPDREREIALLPAKQPQSPPFLLEPLR